MADFMAEVLGQDKTSEGNIVTVRMTGFGGEGGPLKTRAKARAIAASNFGPDQASYTKSTDREGEWGIDKEEHFADKSKDLFSGPAKGVRERIKTFQNNGLFAEVKSVKEVEQKYFVKDDRLREVFGPLAGTVKSYRYEILVTTKYSFS